MWHELTAGKHHHVPASNHTHPLNHVPVEIIIAIKLFFILWNIAQYYHIVHLFVFVVSGVVFSQSSHQDHRDQPNQKYDHHKTVEYTEPMDLKKQM